MAFIKVTSKGDFSKTFKFLQKAKERRLFRKLDHYAKYGAEMLSMFTPQRTGKTAASWTYEIRINGGFAEIVWINTNSNKGIPIVVLIQYGHGTRNGGYVPPHDFINPTMKPVFDVIGEDAWLEVTGNE